MSGPSPTRCPVCHRDHTRRSRRRSPRDYFYSVTGRLPWRCESCETRFYARPWPLRVHFFAHCKICGNLDLQRIAPDHITGPVAILGKVLKLPALRCDPCRNKFFSVRPLYERARATELSDRRDNMGSKFKLNQ